MLQTSLLLMKSLNKTETPILICDVFFVSKGNLFDVLTFICHFAIKCQNLFSGKNKNQGNSFHELSKPVF